MIIAPLDHFKLKVHMFEKTFNETPKECTMSWEMYDALVNELESLNKIMIHHQDNPRDQSVVLIMGITCTVDPKIQGDTLEFNAPGSLTHSG